MPFGAPTRSSIPGGITMSSTHGGRPLRISVDEAKALYDEQEVTVLDVVSPDTRDRLSQQIKGAVRVDPGDISGAINRVPEDHTVLAY